MEAVLLFVITLFSRFLMNFGNGWTELYAPTLLMQRKWHTVCRNWRLGNVVIVADRNVLRGNCRLAMAKEVFPGQDGKVRRATVQYKSYRTGENIREYRGAENVVISRAVQRLLLLVSVNIKPRETEEELSAQEHK